MSEPALGPDSPPADLYAEVVRLRAQAGGEGRGAGDAALEREEKELRLQRALLHAIFRSAPVGLSIAEAPSGRSLMASDELLRMTGTDYLSGELERFTRAGAVHPDGRPFGLEEYPIVRSLRQGETVRRQLVALQRADGDLMRVEVSSTALRDADGEIVAGVAVMVDVEERERAVERQQLLISELAHRMKNTLAMVQAIVSQTLRAAPSLQDAREQVMQRFAALARAQDILTQTNWDSATLDVVVQGALAPLAEVDQRVDICGPPVRLSSRAALNFTLAMHELATNALKYGALAAAAGRVEVCWRVEDGQLDFAWVEQGGPPVAAPSHKGFGSRLLDSLSRTFGAQSDIAYAADGVSWSVRVDLAAIQAG